MHSLPIPVLSIIVGALLLLLGRKLFWLFVAALGFAVGIQATQYVIHDPPIWIALSAALVLGFAGALLALLLQKVAVAVAGFIGGGRLAVGLAAAFFIQHDQYSAVIFIIGGIVGALLLLALFDWALILLSSVEGANLIRQGLVLPERGTQIVFIALIVVGIVVQASLLRRRRRVSAT
jgi:hypothetical protein